MTATAFQFRRHIGPGELAALEQLVDSPQGQWWRDVLVHRDLVLAVRDGTLNAYHRGASIFRITFRDGAVVPETHVKYLVRQRQAYATMAADDRFVLPAPALWPAYEGSATLNEMIAAAAGLAGLEKEGLHTLINGNPRVIDVEVAFRNVAPITDAPSDDEPDHDDGKAHPAAAEGVRQDRLDAATLEEHDGQLRVVFHEAKHFTNAALRASPQHTPPVAAQLARYRATLQHHAPDIAASYTEVCRALVALDAMRAKARMLAGSIGSHVMRPDPLIQRAAVGEPLHVDPEPRLIVFGFDQDQRDGSVWTRHRERLTELGLTVHAVGKPKAGDTAAFARKRAS